MNAPLQINWEAHVEALPVATVILGPSPKSGADVRASNAAARALLDVPHFHDVHPSKGYVRSRDWQPLLAAWVAFAEGRTARFEHRFGWNKADGSAIQLQAHAQKLLCGDIILWLRPATTHDLNPLEARTYA